MTRYLRRRSNLSLKHRSPPGVRMPSSLQHSRTRSLHSSGSNSSTVYSARTLWLLAIGIALAAGLPLAAQTTAPPAAPQAPAAPSSRPCRVRGVISSGEVMLAGVSITAKAGEKVVALTSSDIDGTFTVPVAPGTYTLRVELTGFLPVEKEVTLGQPPCELADT